jgi:hypothetical protein
MVLTLTKINSGDPPTKRKQKLIDKDGRINKVVSDYKKEDLFDFMDNLREETFVHFTYFCDFFCFFIRY